MNEFILSITSIIGVLGTFYVNNSLKLGDVKASAGLSLIVGLFFYCFPNILNSELTEQIPLVFIGASFVGMTSSKVLNNYVLLTISALLFTFLFIYSSQFFTGFGGALGTTACVSLLTVCGIEIVFKKAKSIR